MADEDLYLVTRDMTTDEGEEAAFDECYQLSQALVALCQRKDPRQLCVALSGVLAAVIAQSWATPDDLAWALRSVQRTIAHEWAREHPPAGRLQ